MRKKLKQLSSLLAGFLASATPLMATDLPLEEHAESIRDMRAWRQEQMDLFRDYAFSDKTFEIFRETLQQSDDLILSLVNLCARAESFRHLVVYKIAHHYRASPEHALEAWRYPANTALGNPDFEIFVGDEVLKARDLTRGSPLYANVMRLLVERTLKAHLFNFMSGFDFLLKQQFEDQNYFVNVSYDIFTTPAFSAEGDLKEFFNVLVRAQSAIEKSKDDAQVVLGKYNFLGFLREQEGLESIIDFIDRPCEPNLKLKHITHDFDHRTGAPSLWREVESLLRLMKKTRSIGFEAFVKELKEQNLFPIQKDSQSRLFETAHRIQKAKLFYHEIYGLAVQTLYAPGFGEIYPGFQKGLLQNSYEVGGYVMGYYLTQQRWLNLIGRPFDNYGAQYPGIIFIRPLANTQIADETASEDAVMPQLDVIEEDNFFLSATQPLKIFQDGQVSIVFTHQLDADIHKRAIKGTLLHLLIKELVIHEFPRLKNQMADQKRTAIKFTTPTGTVAKQHVLEALNAVYREQKQTLYAHFSHHVPHDFVANDLWKFRLSCSIKALCDFVRDANPDDRIKLMTREEYHAAGSQSQAKLEALWAYLRQPLELRAKKSSTLQCPSLSDKLYKEALEKLPIKIAAYAAVLDVYGLQEISPQKAFDAKLQDIKRQYQAYLDQQNAELLGLPSPQPQKLKKKSKKRSTHLKPPASLCSVAQDREQQLQGSQADTPQAPSHIKRAMMPNEDKIAGPSAVVQSSVFAKRSFAEVAACAAAKPIPTTTKNNKLQEPSGTQASRSQKLPRPQKKRGSLGGAASASLVPETLVQKEKHEQQAVAPKVHPESDRPVENNPEQSPQEFSHKNNELKGIQKDVPLTSAALLQELQVPLSQEASANEIESEQVSVQEPLADQGLAHQEEEGDSKVTVPIPPINLVRELDEDMPNAVSEIPEADDNEQESQKLKHIPSADSDEVPYPFILAQKDQEIHFLRHQLGEAYGFMIQRATASPRPLDHEEFHSQDTTVILRKQADSLHRAFSYEQNRANAMENAHFLVLETLKRVTGFDPEEIQAAIWETERFMREKQNQGVLN